MKTLKSINNNISLALSHFPLLEIRPLSVSADLNNIQRLASDRLGWKRISKLVVTAAYDKVARELKLEFRI